MSHITISDGAVTLDGLRCDDPVVVDLLRRHPEDGYQDLVRRMLAVGARGLLSMGMGVDIAEVDERVRRSLEDVTLETRREVAALLEQGRRALETSLDPGQRSSPVGRTLADLTSWREAFLERLDPESTDSHTRRLLEHLQALLGPGGALEQQLSSALDPTSDESGLGRLSAAVEHRLTELRDLIFEQRGRRLEAERGTAKGLDFEDRLEEDLRRVARHLGAVVERTSRAPGALSVEAVVGDYVLVLPGGARVVVEAKNVKTIGLTGSDGILAELDRALANRRADVAVCVSARDAYPAEVGPFGVYGKRLLVTDDGDGTMLWVALRWATWAATAGGSDLSAADPAVVDDRLQRIRQLSRLFSANRRALTDIGGSVEQVRASLDEMRAELVHLLDDLETELARGSGEVVRMREAG